MTVCRPTAQLIDAVHGAVDSCSDHPGVTWDRERPQRFDRLCGDAAHVHSPAGGQGMNTGIQDAVSLAGALTRTLEDGNDARLDAWAIERHRIARDVVAMTDRMTRIATMKSATGQTLRNAAVSFAGHLPPVRTALARNLAELHDR